MVCIYDGSFLSRSMLEGFIIHSLSILLYIQVLIWHSRLILKVLLLPLYIDIDIYIDRYIGIDIDVYMITYWHVFCFIPRTWVAWTEIFPRWSSWTGIPTPTNSSLRMLSICPGGLEMTMTEAWLILQLFLEVCIQLYPSNPYLVMPILKRHWYIRFLSTNFSY